MARAWTGASRVLPWTMPLFHLPLLPPFRSYRNSVCHSWHVFSPVELSCFLGLVQHTQFQGRVGLNGHHLVVVPFHPFRTRNEPDLFPDRTGMEHEFEPDRFGFDPFTNPIGNRSEGTTNLPFYPRRHAFPWVGVSRSDPRPHRPVLPWRVEEEEGGGTERSKRKERDEDVSELFLSDETRRTRETREEPPSQCLWPRAMRS